MGMTNLNLAKIATTSASDLTRPGDHFLFLLLPVDSTSTWKVQPLALSWPAVSERPEWPNNMFQRRTGDMCKRFFVAASKLLSVFQADMLLLFPDGAPCAQQLRSSQICSFETKFPFKLLHAWLKLRYHPNWNTQQINKLDMYASLYWFRCWLIGINVKEERDRLWSCSSSSSSALLLLWRVLESYDCEHSTSGLSSEDDLAQLILSCKFSFAFDHAELAIKQACHSGCFYFYLLISLFIFIFFSHCLSYSKLTFYQLYILGTAKIYFIIFPQPWIQYTSPGLYINCLSCDIKTSYCVEVSMAPLNDKLDGLIPSSQFYSSIRESSCEKKSCSYGNLTNINLWKEMILPMNFFLLKLYISKVSQKNWQAERDKPLNLLELNHEAQIFYRSKIYVSTKIFHHQSLINSPSSLKDKMENSLNELKFLMKICCKLMRKTMRNYTKTFIFYSTLSVMMYLHTEVPQDGTTIEILIQIQIQRSKLP
ncbi:hypothetical protein VP01_2905g2 [Puccinia sorghi]|uniref:Uncharacterized protein n=1 Tax=Puccinia sorghi TaxID=27349 RepID=A0A0L6V1F4_9BASI|nr:hypothetical protein VP01_2905g2 [Puccinia sorghi]